MATTLMEEAPSLVMAQTLPWLRGLGGLWPLNPCKMVTFRWSVHPTKCLTTIIDSFYYSMKSSIPYNNPDEPYHAAYHSGNEQFPGPMTSISPHLPEADLNQDASSEWRFRTCWVSHAGEDEIHLTIALKKS